MAENTISPLMWRPREVLSRTTRGWRDKGLCDVTGVGIREGKAG